MLNEVPESHKEPYLQIVKNVVIRTLRIIWLPNKDTLMYHFAFDLSQKTTKRTGIYNLDTIFDSLGLIGPITVIGKAVKTQNISRSRSQSRLWKALE